MGTARRGGAQLGRVLGVPLAALLESIARRSDARVGLALVYHKVEARPGERRRELLPALASSLFAAQVRLLAARYRLVEATELPAAVLERRQGERFPVAVTFDDDLRSHVEVVAPVLTAAAVPATFFLTGASLDGPSPFWWERLQVAIDTGVDVAALGVPVERDGASIHELGRALEDLPRRAREEVDARLAGTVDPATPNPGLQTQHVRDLAEQGFEIGFHTRGHHRLPDLGTEELALAMHDGRKQLEAAIGRALSSIAYPHGAADARVADAARSAGFRVGFTGRPGAVTPRDDPLLLKRVSPSYHSVGALALAVAWTLYRAAESR